MTKISRPSSIAFGLYVILATPGVATASTFLWKVLAPNGQALYLGGSWHALRSSDYPLPSSFTRALDASTKLALEANPDEIRAADKSLVKASLYPSGDSLKNHVDPRTYNYISRLFALAKVPPEKIARYRPWFIALMLQSPGRSGMSPSLGVEEFLVQRARARSKQIVGLETAREHSEIFSGLSDRESEALLLLTFIPPDGGSPDLSRLMNAWRNGDSELPWQVIHDGFRDFPSLGERILDTRNRKWIPKIENYLGSGETYFVVVGAAHFGGPNGLLALLRARGYKIEQL
jgi:uncharacterized protein YbaP (TraB family)